MRVAFVLLLVAALGGGSAWGAWTNELEESAREPDAHVSTVTPVLSMRRVPESLLRPRRDASVVAALADIPERIPGDACLVVTDAGRPLVEHAADRPLVPASTQKLLVGAALLDLVGVDTRFETSLFATEPPVGGVISGDVWLVGGGDPLLTTEPYRTRNGDLPRPATPFEDLADAVVTAGITTIDGGVIGDGARYDDVYDVPSWPERYREQVSTGPLAGLTVNDGLTTFTPTRVAINPGTPASDPPAHAASLLVDLLEERGVSVGGQGRSGTMPEGTVTVATIESLPSLTVVTQMMQWSDNTTAELLLKEIGVRGGGEGSTAFGGSVMVATLAAMGVRVDGVTPVDGSGLALENRVTCQALTDVLDIAGRHSPLATALAVAGHSGTLRNRLIDTPAEGLVFAKTGSLRHVNALAGFVDSPNGRTYTFAIVANLEDREFMPALAGELQDELALTLATLPEVTVSPELEPVMPLSQ